MRTTVRLAMAAFLLAAAGLGSCARHRNEAALEPGAFTAPSNDERVAALREMIERENAAGARDKNEARDRVIRVKPYFYKEYGEYPRGKDGVQIETFESESRVRPLRAEVTQDKIRYSTKLRTKREQSRLDDDWYRATGVETQSFELRNGRWVRTGRTFVADKTEHQVSGSWAPVVEEEAPSPIAEEPARGWFGRAWDFVTGGR